MDTQTINDIALNAGQTFPWHELYLPNVQKALDFYTEALGFGSEEFEMGEMGTYHMLTRNGKAVAGIMSTERPDMSQIPPHWSTYLSVDDVDSRLEKCKGLGANVLVPPMDIPEVGRMALIQDPQGATIWLFKGSS